MESGLEAEYASLLCLCYLHNSIGKGGNILSTSLPTTIMKQSFNEHLTLCYNRGIVNFINRAVREEK